MAEATTYQLTRADAVAIFQGLGYKTADTWKRGRLESKVKTLGEIVDDDVVLEGDDEDHASHINNVLDEVLAALDAEQEIELVTGDVEESEPEEKAPAPKKKPRKKAAKPKAEEAEEDDEEPAPKAKKKPARKKKPAAEEDDDSVPVKKKPAKKGTGPKKVGIIATVVAALEKASEKKPLTRDQALSLLEKKFPEREADGMKKTVMIQLPGQLRKKGKAIEEKMMKDGKTKGYWIEADE